jgi:hypothetical protein
MQETKERRTKEEGGSNQKSDAGEEGVKNKHGKGTERGGS